MATSTKKTRPAAEPSPQTASAVPAAPAKKKAAATKTAVTTAAKKAVKPAAKAAAAPAPMPAPAPAKKAAAAKKTVPAKKAKATVVEAAAAVTEAPKPAAKAPAKKAAAKTAAVKTTAAKPAPAKKAAAKKTASAQPSPAPVAEPTPKPAAKKAAAKKVAAKEVAAKKAPAKKAAAKKAAAKGKSRSAKPAATPEATPESAEAVVDTPMVEPVAVVDAAALPAPEAVAAADIALDEAAPVQADAAAAAVEEPALDDETDDGEPAPATDGSAAPTGAGRNRRRRRSRGGRGERGERAAPDNTAPAVDLDLGALQAAAAQAGEGPAPIAEVDLNLDAADAAEPAEAEPTEAVAELAAPAQAPAPQAPALVRPPLSGPADSAIVLGGADDAPQILWRPGHGASDTLLRAAAEITDSDGRIAPDDDNALPTLLRLAGEAHHRLSVQAAVWTLLAANRDARSRAHALELAYPDGPASAALQTLLRSPLPLFQAEGALFSVVAGRALIADERGLGKSVQAIAATQLWQRHFGVQRVALLCAPAQAVAWQRAFSRFAGQVAQLVSGGLHQRQALWSAETGVRILTPDALASDAAHLAHWAPELVVIDEPAAVPGWQTLDAPNALVLCGTPLERQPELLHALVDWLDQPRQGPLGALRQLLAAQAGGVQLAEDEIEAITAALSRVMLQRQRDEVAEQLPALVHSERLLPLAPPQQQAHQQQLAVLRRLLAGWQRSGYLSDSDQLRLGAALQEAQAVCHRAEPGQADSPLADATVQAIAGQLADWAATGATSVAVLCASPAQRQQLAERLPTQLGLDLAPVLQPALLLDGEPLPEGLEAVLQVGVPWRPRRSAPRGGQGNGNSRGRRHDSAAPRGQQWLYLVGQDSLEAGLFDTLAQRSDVPRSLSEGGRAYLQGERLQDWLQAVAAALQAVGPAL